MTTVKLVALTTRGRGWWRLLLPLLVPLVLVVGVGLAAPAHADDVVVSDVVGKAGRVVERAREDETLTGGDRVPLEGKWADEEPSGRFENKTTDSGEEVEELVGGVGGAISDAARDVGSAIGDAARDVGTWVGDKATEVAEGVQNLAEDVGNVVATVGDLIGMSIPEAIEAVMGAVADWLAGTLGSAAAWLLAALVQFAFSLTSADLDAEFVYKWAGRVFAIAIPLTLLLAFWQLASSAVRGRPLQGVRQAGVGATAATAGTMVAIPIIAAISSAVDYLCVAMAGDLETQVTDLASAITDLWSPATLAAVAATMGLGAASVILTLIFIIFAVCVIIAGIGLIITLVLRELSLYACTVILPMAMSGLAARTSRRWPRQVISWLLALVVSKLGVLIVLGLGLTILTDRIGDFSAEGLGAIAWLGDLAVGVAMVLLAMFAPWVAFKFFDFLGEESVAWMQGSVQGGVERGGEVVGQTTKTVLALAAAAAGGIAGAGAGAGAGAEAGGAASTSEAASATAGTRGMGVEGATGQTIGQGQAAAQAPGEAPGQAAAQAQPAGQSAADPGRAAADAPVSASAGEPVGGQTGAWAAEPAPAEAPASSVEGPAQAPSVVDGQTGQTISRQPTSRGRTAPAGRRGAGAPVGGRSSAPSSMPSGGGDAAPRPRRGVSEKVNDLADRLDTRRGEGGRRRLPSPVPRMYGGGFGHGALEDDIPGWEVS